MPPEAPIGAKGAARPPRKTHDVMWRFASDSAPKAPGEGGMCVEAVGKPENRQRRAGRSGTRAQSNRTAGHQEKQPVA